MSYQLSIYKTSLSDLYRSLRKELIIGNPSLECADKKYVNQVKRALDHNIPLPPLAFVQLPDQRIFIAEGLYQINAIRLLTGQKLSLIDKYTTELTYSLYQVNSAQEAIRLIAHFQNISYVDAIEHATQAIYSTQIAKMCSIFFDTFGDVFKEKHLYRKVEYAFFKFLYYYTNGLDYESEDEYISEDLTIEENLTQLMLSKMLPSTKVVIYVYRMFTEFLPTFRKTVTSEGFTKLNVLFSARGNPFDVDAEVLFLLFYTYFCRVSCKTAPVELVTSRIIMSRTTNYCELFKQLPTTCSEGRTLMTRIKNLVVDRFLLPRSPLYDMSWYSDVSSTEPLDVCAMLDLAEDKSEEFRKCVEVSYETADLRTSEFIRAPRFCGGNKHY